jgi:hypothetical protein
MVEYRQHAVFDPSVLLDDPAHAAEELGLVGNHNGNVLHRVGAWRWPLFQRFRDLVLELIDGHRTMDLGGAAAPIGYGAIVIDRLAADKAPWDVEGRFDVIVCSHILEHIPDIGLMLLCLRYKVNLGGHLIIQSPSPANEKLRAGNWPFHAQTLSLSFSDVEGSVDRYFVDKALITLGFTILAAVDDGDNIFLIAKAKEAAGGLL